MPFSKYLLAAIGPLAFITFAYAQPGSSEMHRRGGMAESGMTSDAQRMPFDHQFLDTMSMHHAHGIQMAELVKDRAAHEELKQMAQKMIEDQQQDIQKLQSMKAQWYAGQGDAANRQMRGMRESVQRREKNVDALKAAKGEKFDLLFLDVMSRHHANGIRMAQHAQSRAAHQEVKDIAKEISDRQGAEKAEMAKMRKEWSGGSKS